MKKNQGITLSRFLYKCIGVVIFGCFYEINIAVVIPAKLIYELLKP
jgi:hypothetical protein